MAENNEERPQEQGEGENPQEPEPEKKRKRVIALKPEHLETSKGLKKLYEMTNQVKWEDAMTTESAMNMVVMTIKTWQNQLLPKYYYEYFLQRCQALGSNKIVSAYLNKVRRIHKGLDEWPEEEHEEHLNEKQHKEENAEHLNPETPLQSDKDLEKFQLRSELASKLAFTPSERKEEKKEGKEQNEQEKEVEDLLDEDLRMFEEMNKRLNEKKKVEISDDEGEIELQIEDSAIEGFDYDYDD